MNFIINEDSQFEVIHISHYNENQENQINTRKNAMALMLTNLFIFMNLQNEEDSLIWRFWKFLKFLKIYTYKQYPSSIFGALEYEIMEALSKTTDTLGDESAELHFIFGNSFSHSNRIVRSEISEYYQETKFANVLHFFFIQEIFDRTLSSFKMSKNGVMLTNFNGFRMGITNEKHFQGEESINGYWMVFIVEMFGRLFTKLARWMFGFNVYYPEEKNDFIEWLTIV